ncbi:MAG TPA: NUDIX hydrolase [Pirellulaceae bacterium]|nr:NUDIX hydrolase [Pirellulaceae bacterium]
MDAQPQLLLQTSKFRVVREIQTTPGGKTKTREIVRHPGACVIVPLLDDGRVCLIRNYRIAVGQTLIELPAGTLEPPEPPHVTAERELIEETGYRAAKIGLLHAFYLSPGILDEKMHLYLATGLTSGETAREEGEEIENWLVPWDEAVGMIFGGQIQDAKTIVGLLWVDRLQQP